MRLRNFAESLAIVLRGSRVYAIDYTACKSRYEHQDESRQMPLVYTRVVRINQVDRLSSIILSASRDLQSFRFISRLCENRPEVPTAL